MPIIKIVQMQEYSYEKGVGKDKHSVSVKENTDLITENVNFINFKDANILLGIKLPFSIIIPLNHNLQFLLAMIL